MPFLTNLLIRPAENKSGQQKARVITLNLRSAAERADSLPSDNSCEPLLRQYIVEMELKPNQAGTGKGQTSYAQYLKTEYVRSKTKLPLLAFFNTSSLVPDEIKGIEQYYKFDQLSLSIKPTEHAQSFIEDIGLSADRLVHESRCINKFVTISLALPGPGGALEAEGLKLDKEGDGSKAILYCLLDQKVKESLGTKDINYYIRIEWKFNGETYYDDLELTITPEHRTWYCSLDFGSEASQYKMRNSFYTDDYFSYPSENKDAKYGNLVLGLNRLVNGINHSVDEEAKKKSCPFDKLEFNQNTEDDFNLYSSIFYGLTSYSFSDAKGFEFKLGQKKDGDEVVNYLWPREKDWQGKFALLPNLKIVYELYNLKRFYDTQLDFTSPLLREMIHSSLNQVARDLKLTGSDNTPDINRFELIKDYFYRTILNTIILSVLSQVHRNHLNAASKSGYYTLNVEDNPTNNFVFKILLPNMLTSGDVTLLLDFIQQDRWNYKTEVLKLVDTITEPKLREELKETFNAMNAVEFLFISESDAVASSIAYKLYDNKDPFQNLFIVDVGKGTTDISILEVDAHAKKLFTNFRSGFAGAGNFMSYFFAMAFINEIFESLGVGDISLDAYRGAVELFKSVHESGGDTPGDKLPYMLNPDVLAEVISEGEDYVIHKQQFAKLIDSIKISYLGKDESTVDLAEILKQVEMQASTGGPGKINFGGGHFNSINIKEIRKFLSGRKFKFRFERSEKIVREGYDILSGYLEGILQFPMNAPGLQNKRSCLVLSGRGSLDSELSNRITNIFKKYFNGLQVKTIEEIFRSEESRRSEVRKNCAVVGGSAEEVFLNYGSNVTGRIWGKSSPGKLSMFTNLLGKKKNTGSAGYYPLENYDPGKTDFYFKQIENLREGASTLYEYSINGYRVEDQGLGVKIPKGSSVFFTNNNIVLSYKDAEGTWRLSPVKQDFRSAYGNDEGEDELQSRQEDLVRLTTFSLFPIIPMKAFLENIKKYRDEK